MQKWKTLESGMALDNRWFKVRRDKVELPNGKILDDYFVWESGNVAMVVPITQDNKLVFVRQYKHGVAEVMIEYPAGYVDKMEDPAQGAKRELAEETGYVAQEVIPLAKVVHNPTKETGCLFIYLAKVSNKQSQKNLDVSEEIEVLELPIRDVLEMIADGRIWVAGTIAGTYLALAKLGLLQVNL
ncbi:MAG: NUDIX hydrolase [bacterium]|nr:NUDIX hydrolase [bacterium]